MDSKKIIERLIKIADNQQKIITRLAQQNPPATSLPISGTHPNYASQIKQQLDSKLPNTVFSVVLDKMQSKPTQNMYVITFYQGALTEENKASLWPNVMSVVKAADPTAGATSAEADFPATFHQA